MNASEAGLAGQNKESDKMFRNTALAISVVMGSFVGSTGESVRPKERRDAAISVIEELGGKVQTAVVSVYLEGTRANDSTLRHLREFPELRTLRLFKSGVTDAGLRHLKVLKNLTRLEFVGMIGDEGLAHLGALRQLKKLYLPNSVITDAGLKHLRHLTHLESLNLSRSEVTDAGLEHVGKLIKLRELTLYETGISDSGLKHLQELDHLKLLILKRTNVTAAGVKKLQRELPGVKISHSPRT